MSTQALLILNVSIAQSSEAKKVPKLHPIHWRTSYLRLY